MHLQIHTHTHTRVVMLQWIFKICTLYHLSFTFHFHVRQDRRTCCIPMLRSFLLFWGWMQCLFRIACFSFFSCIKRQIYLLVKPSSEDFSEFSRPWGKWKVIKLLEGYQTFAGSWMETICLVFLSPLRLCNLLAFSHKKPCLSVQVLKCASYRKEGQDFFQSRKICVLSSFVFFA